MSSPFEQGAQMGQERAKARKDFISRYKQLLLKIHPDKFNGNGWEKESNEITQRLNNLRNGCDEKGQKDPNLDPWQSRIDKLDEIERELEDFLKRSGENNDKKEASGKKEASDKKNKNTKDKEKTKKEPEPKSEPEPEKEKKDEAEPEKSDSGEAEGINKDFEKDFGKKEEGKSGAEEIEKDLTHDLGGKKEGETKNQEKNPEDKGKEKQKGAETMKELEEKLGVARIDFAEMDFKKRNMWKKVSDFFNISKRKEKNEKIAEDSKGLTAAEQKIQKGREYDQDIAYMEAVYENVLYNYKTAWLEDLEKKGLEGKDLDKELGTMVRYFDADELCNLNNTRADVRAKTAEGSKMEKVRDGFLKAANVYNKIPPKWRLAVGILIAGGTLTAGAMAAMPVGAAIGGAAVCTKIAAGFMALGITKKFLVGMGMGSGAALKTDAMAEGVSNWNKKRRTDKEVGNFEKSIAELSPENKLEEYKKIANNKISDIDRKLQNGKLEALLRKSGAAFVGMGVGYLIGSGELFRWFSKTTGAGDFVKEKISDVAKSDIVREFMQKHGFERFVITDQSISHPQSEILKNPVIHDWDKQPPSIFKDTALGAEEAAAGKISDVVEVKKGDSIWKIVDQKLQEHYGAKFSDLDPAKKTYIIDALKDRVASNPQAFGLENADQIQVGQKVDLSEMFNKEKEINNIFGYAENLSQADMDNISHYNAATSHIETPVEAEKMADMAGESINEEPNVPINSEVEIEKEFSDVDQSSKSKIIEQIDEKNNEISQIEKHPATGYNPDDPTKYFHDIDNLKADQRELLDKLMQENTVPAVAGDIRMNITNANPENWKQIKDLTFDKIRNANVSDGVKNNIAKAYRFNLNVLGKESMPKYGETVAKWTERVARLFMKIKK